MALRNAYKQRVQSDGEDREHLGSIHSVEALMRGGNHSRAPGDKLNRGVSKTSDVIENAFGFLKSSTYDAYSRYGSDGESDVTDVVGYRDNFTFGPPRSSQYKASGGYGPTSASYDGDAPRDRRYPVGLADQLSYDDDLSLKRTGNGYIGNGMAPDMYRYKRLPRIGENGTAIPNNGRYIGRHSRYPDDIRRETSYNSYRQPYPDRRPYYSYAADDGPAYSEDDWYPEDDRQGYISRYPDSEDGYDSRSVNTVERTKTKADHVTTESSSRRRPLFVVILIISLLIAAGVAAVITLHFLGYFDSKPEWKDGYDVEAIFSNTYLPAWDDKNSEEYKEAANTFKSLTGSVLDKTYPGSYGVQVNNISKGSTKYSFVVELAKETNTTNLESVLKKGYREALTNNRTELILTSVSAKVNEKYTKSAAPVTTETNSFTIVTTESPETTEGEKTTAATTQTKDDGNKTNSFTSVTTESLETTEGEKTTAATTQTKNDGNM